MSVSTIILFVLFSLYVHVFLLSFRLPCFNKLELSLSRKPMELTDKSRTLDTIIIICICQVSDIFHISLHIQLQVRWLCACPVCLWHYSLLFTSLLAIANITITERNYIQALFTVGMQCYNLGQDTNFT